VLGHGFPVGRRDISHLVAGSATLAADLATEEGAPNKRHSRNRSRTRSRIHTGQIQICRSV
jgi:hypothetical protein